MALNLSKGQSINLNKESGTTLTSITMGLGWDVAKGKSIDLDASCLMYDENHKVFDTIYFGSLKSKDGSVKHTGDNRSGAGAGDDEQINVNLGIVNHTVKTLVFTVNSYQGQSFNQIENAYCRLINSSNNQEIARFNLSAKGDHTGIIMASVSNVNGEWTFKALGEACAGRTVSDMKHEILNLI